MSDTMTEQQKARVNGFTQRVIADNETYTLELLIKPDTDLDGRFTAFDLDTSEYIRVNGWLFTHEFA